MPKLSDPSRRLFTDDPESTEALLRRMGETLSQLRPGEQLRDYIARRDEIVHENVERILELVAAFDAFDIIELMRQREAPFSLTGYKESQDEGQVALIEVVALILLARGSREAMKEASDEQPNQVIDEFHSRASTILRVGTLSVLVDGESNSYGPLTRLAAEHRAGELNTRGKQYSHIQDQLNHDLFSPSTISSLMLARAGFDFEDFNNVRTAINQSYNDGLVTARDQLGSVVTDWVAGGRQAQDVTQVDLGRSSVYDMFVYPGGRAAFTEEEISLSSGVPVERVKGVLELFSVAFNECDAATSVLSFLDGQSTFVRANLIADANGNYITMHAPIGTDCFRQVIEDTFKPNQSSWTRYDRHRAKVSEALTVRYLESILGVSTTHAQLRYFRPRAGVEANALSSDAANITEIAQVAEADALFLIEDVAVCVEVKGRSISPGARQGNVRRLSTDLEATIGDASAQAWRLQQLIEENRGIWLDNCNWLDLAHIREIHSIVVCLEDMGLLAVAIDELVRSGVIVEKRFPWIVSLHDLAIIAEVLDRPAEFLLFLRRRTESGVSKFFSAPDELDLFMLFLSGGLYVESNPDAIFQLYPASGKPTKAARARYKAQAVPTRVSTHTDPLDAWIYFQEGASLEEASKPEFATITEIREIVDFLQDGHKPGWLRFGADLLDLSYEAQQFLAKGLHDLAEKTGDDHEFHSIACCYAGEWGFASLFACSWPLGMTGDQARHRMGTYLIAKKHQLRSDRALGVLLNERAQIRAVQYDNSLPSDNAELDALGKAIGLQPIGTPSRPAAQTRSRSRKRPKRQRKGKRR